MAKIGGVSPVRGIKSVGEASRSVLRAGAAGATKGGEAAGQASAKYLFGGDLYCRKEPFGSDLYSQKPPSGGDLYCNINSNMLYR